MNSRKILMLSLCLVLWMQIPGQAQETPGEAQIMSALSSVLPPYWSAESVDIQASVNDGDEIEPLYRQRFMANVVPDEDLYAAAPRNQALGPFTVVVATRAAAEPRKLYGIASSTLALGQWETKVVLENSVDGLGMPRSFFDRPLIVAGSNEANQVAANLLNAQELVKTLAEGLARASANAEVLEQIAAQEQEALEVANRQRLEALMAKYEQERASITATAETLKAVSEAEAETVAHRNLVSALETLADEKKRAAEIEKQVATAEIKEKTARYDALLVALRSDNLSQKHATFDLAIASDQKHLKEMAIAEAMKSGDDGLQAKALMALISKSPEIGITIYGQDDSLSREHIFEIKSLDESNMSFSGNYIYSGSYSYEQNWPNGTGSIQRDRISLRGWFEEYHDFACVVNAQVNDQGILVGSMRCNSDSVSEKVQLNL